MTGTKKEELKQLVAISIIGLFACGQGSKSIPEAASIETLEPVENIENQKPLTNHSDKYIDTKYEYTDSTGKRLIMENSLPKGGLKYTDPTGKDFVYAIFWTRITNETENPLKLSIHFPADSFELPSSPDNYFKIVLPAKKMTLDKAHLFNYGLTDTDFNASLNSKLEHSSLQKTINPNETSLFYVVTLFKQGVEGAVRTGLSLKDGKLYYRVNDKEILCGKINF